MILTAILLLRASTSPAQDINQASAILNNVAGVYRAARSCYLDGKVTSQVKSNGIEAKIESSFIWASVSPTRIRMEAKSPMMMEIVIVSDGPTAWEYWPNLKQYARKQSGLTTITSKGVDSQDYTQEKEEYARGTALGMGIGIPKYQEIADSLQEARLLREEALRINGDGVDCHP